MVGDAAVLSPGAYAAGSAGILVAVGALGLGAVRLRRSLLPGWTGAPARLAEVVLALGALTLSAQLLGTVGGLRSGWVLLAAIGSGGIMAGAARLWAPPARPADPPGTDDLAGAPGPGVDTPPRPGADRPPGPDIEVRHSPRVEVLAAVVATAVVVVQWGAYTADALSRGMTHPDTIWYHGPFTARFLQQGRFGGLAGLGYESLRHYPFGSELLHALAALPFDRDVLSPLINLGWFALSLLAAWCAGRRRGVGGLCVLGAVVVLGVPVVTGTQAGQASNDVIPAVLLLAAAALLVEGGLAPAPTALAALAAGLAVGTKLIVAAPVAVLTIGVTVLALRAGRPVVAACCWGALLVGGGYWFARNWAALDNPLPWYGLDLGPLSFPRRFDESGDALADFVTDRDAWRDLYLPGLAPALGRAWPVVLGLPFVGALAALLRGGSEQGRLERLLGVAVLAGFVTHVFTPYTGGPGFAANLRYLAPVLLVGFALLASGLAGAGARWRQVTVAVLLGVVVVHAAGASGSKVSPWPSDRLLPGLLLGLAVPAAFAVRTAVANYPGLRRHRRAAAAALLCVAAGGGWFVQRHYLEHRYVDAGLHLDALNSYFHEVRDARIAVIGTETYPFFGPDLSNRVEQVEGPAAAAGAEGCRGWRVRLAGRFDYLVYTRQGGFLAPAPPLEWFASDRSATPVRQSADGIVFRLDGPLDPQGCDR